LETYVGAVDQGFATDRPGWHIEHVAETGSTNDDLVAAAKAGAPSGTVLVTDHQTAGRGRLGRKWDAPPATSLLVSVLVRPSPAAAQRLHGATQAVGLSAQAACADVAGFRPELKWPNDLMVGPRKLAGVLSEALPGAVVLGMGLNVAWPPEPTDLAISSSSAAGRAIGRDDLLAAYLDHMARRLEQWEHDPDSLHTDYRSALATLGRAVRVELASMTIEGTAVDVAPDGQLVVASDGAQHLVSAADVVHLRGSVT
jgi:BirA family biotin operon repressor/biotin-[acetyl-CoA-carboxylase] ligase